MIRHVIDHALLTTHFQPIVRLEQGQVFGYEALTRGPADTPLATPRALFAAAADEDLLIELEQLCWRTALKTAAAQVDDRTASCRLFMNVLPDTLSTSSFTRRIRGLLEEVRIDPAQIVIELSESARIDDYDEFRVVISEYRALGVKVAIDDAGAGHSGLQVMAEIVPDFIKIDAGLIRDLHRHKARRATVEAVVVLARMLAIDVIAEGIETPEELASLRSLGVDLGQGYLLGRPAPRMQQVSREHFPARSVATAAHVAPHNPSDAIGVLAMPCPTIPRGTELAAVVREFESGQGDGIVIIDGARPVGLLMKTRAFQHLGRAYGREIYLRRPVELVANTLPLIVDADVALDEVSRRAMARPVESLYDHIIVTRDDTLLGFVSVPQLIAAITDARVVAARHANPLTGLPGNPVIEREIRSRLGGDPTIALMHLDLDDFKAFNDTYGFHRGDVAITMTADLIGQELRAATGDEHFLGHIGGDDFLAIVGARVAQEVASAIAETFQARIAALYDEDHRAQGTIWAPARDGDREEFPIMTLSVALAYVSSDEDRHYAELLDALTAAKREAKLRKRERRSMARIGGD
jgi:diguanylate cyclase (GGDEF)-like protein